MSYIVSSGITSDGVILENDSMTVLNGGLANSTTVNGGGRLNISSGGSASAVILNSSGRLNVSRGGTAAAVVENGGFAYEWDSSVVVSYLPNVFSGLALSGASASVHSGTTANAVAVNAGGYLYVFAGGLANSAAVNSGGRLYVSEGGKAYDATVNARGGMFVSEGGSAARVALNAEGELVVIGGGAADGIAMASGAALTVSSGATATNITAESGVYLGFVVAPDTWIQGTSGGKAFGIQNAVASAFTVESGFLNVSSGGFAKDVLISAGGRLTVYSGGTAIRVRENGGNVSAMEGGAIAFAPNAFSGVVLANASATVHSGTIANATTVNSRGGLTVFLGGTASGTNVNQGGSVFLSSGGSADGVTLDSGGSLFVYGGGTATNLTASAGAYLAFVVAPGTYIRGTTDGGAIDVNDGVVSGYTVNLGSLSVSGGGIANGITVAPGGRLFVYSGGTVSAIVENGGYVNVAEGADVSFAANAFSGLVLASASATAHSGTVAEAAILDGGGYLNVYEGGTANGATVNSAGFLRLFSGGAASGTVVNELGHLHITDGGVANDTTVNGGSGAYRQGDLYVSGGGTANGVTVNSAGSLTIIRGGAASGVAVNPGGLLYVSRGGTASAVVENGGYVSVADETDVSFVANTFSGVEVSGSATVHSGTVADDTTLASDAKLFLYSGGRITGRTSLGTGAAVSATGGTVDFDLTRTSAGAEALVNNLALVRGTPVYTLTVNEDYRGKGGVYALADGAAGFRGALTVTNASGGALGTLTAGGESLTVGDATYTLALDGGSLTVSVDVPNYVPAKSDVDGNGVSDVMFVWTGEHGEGNHQHGYWMNGTNDWRSADAAHPAEWDNLGCHDMSGDGRADAVMFGNVVVDGVKGAHVGYYQDGRDTDENWVTIGHLDNREDVAWQNAVGNLTGGEACSIVWYAPERYALGAWIDGTDEWVGIEADFGGDDWTLAGCGDFDGDGKESILMSGLGGAFFYTAGLDGAVESLGSLNWSGWDVRAIGDFAGDGRDDMVLFHLETGSMVMIADGDIDHYASLGQLDAKDWFVVGAGDYDGDARDDLLVRQYSTGMLGYYSAGDTTRWNVLGYGVDMTWTVISPS